MWAIVLLGIAEVNNMAITCMALRPDLATYTVVLSKNVVAFISLRRLPRSDKVKKNRSYTAEAL